jgi:hypothetical protein
MFVPIDIDRHGKSRRPALKDATIPGCLWSREADASATSRALAIDRHLTTA